MERDAQFAPESWVNQWPRPQKKASVYVSDLQVEPESQKIRQPEIEITFHKDYGICFYLKFISNFETLKLTLFVICIRTLPDSSLI